MGLTRPRAEQIYNLDYKQATRVATTTDVTLAGGAPAVVDGVTLVVNDRVLVTGQATASQNGIYDVVSVGTGANGTWARTSDANATGEIEAGMIIMVTEGAVYADTQWKLITDNPIVIDTTGLTFTQNYSANSISGGTSNVTVYSNANVTISSAGTPNVLTISSTGVVVSGTESVTGTITVGNVVTGGNVSALGNIVGNNLTVNNIESVTGTITGGNLSTSGNVSATGTVTGNNLLTGGNVSASGTVVGGIITATGNITGANLLTTGIVSTSSNIYGGNLIVNNIESITGNITGGNIATGGKISATGNIAGNYLLANIAYATGYTASRIYNGTSEVDIATANGNANISISGTSNVAVFATDGMYVVGNVSATGNIVGSNLVVNNIESVTGNITGGNLVTSGQVSATGNLVGNYLLANIAYATGYTASRIYNGTSEVDIGTAGGNANITIGGVSNVAVFATTGEYVTGEISASGNVTAGNLVTAGAVTASGNVTGAYLFGNGYNLSGLANVTTGTAPPSSPIIGDIWINTNSGTQYIWFNDGAGSQWAEMEAQTAYSSTGYANLTTNTVNTQVLYNSANAIVGSNSLTFDGTTLTSTNLNAGSLFVSNNSITSQVANSNIAITAQGTGEVVINAHSFDVYSYSNTLPTFQIANTGDTKIFAPVFNSNVGALAIVGSTDGSQQAPQNTGVMLHISGQPGYPSRIYNDAANTYSAFIGRAYNGNATAPTQVLANAVIARFAATPYANGSWPAISTTRIDMVATETQTTSAQGSRMTFWTTPQGTANVVQVMSLTQANLSVTGNIVTSGNITSGGYSGNLVPSIDNAYVLGNATNRWANLWLGPGTLYITDSNIASNATAQLTVLNSVLQINGVNQLQAPGIANGNANIAISNSGNVTITTLPGTPPLDWVFDNSGNMRFASVTEQDNFIGENNGDFFMSGTQSVKLGAGLSGNLVLTVNSANVEVGAGRDYTDQFNVYGTMHAVFNNIYETGGDITADKNVYVGRLTVSDQPGDPNIPGITANSTSTDFSLGVLNDTGNLVINRNVIRNGNHGATDTVTNYFPDVPVGVNTPYEIYGGTDNSILAVELTVILQYGTTSDTDTELTKLLATMNAGGTANLVVLGQSLTTTAFAPATYTAGVAGGVLTVSVQTDPDSSTAYYRYHASEFGGYFGA